MVRILLLPFLLVGLLGLGACAEDTSEIERLIDRGATVLDVRTPEEYAAGHIDGAANLDLGAEDFRDRVDELPRDTYYVVYCASGARATRAIEVMRGLGFGSVVNGGGYDALADLGLPTTE
ncbi:rhodanese-like domain-containing protein [Nocardioides sp. zg-579]|uniref:Rhodanese-like domain-containing protein n=1 Tax=Nocardioides marmotae TaxID=2663857 RepID=A0A6I3IY72_9ACTN|nr:rhodanese-like domain-containing protein [Gordonia jinghuaiqii]MTB94017.1 rhodanese-like domain-containing protein [Nocardioides marmotae]